MSTVDAAVLEAFFLKLAESDRVNEETVHGLREFLRGAKIPKPEELVSLFARTSKGIST